MTAPMLGVTTACEAGIWGAFVVLEMGIALPIALTPEVTQ